MQVFAQAWRQLREAQKVYDAVAEEAASVKIQVRSEDTAKEKVRLAWVVLREKRELGTITSEERKELKRLREEYESRKTALDALRTTRTAILERRYNARHAVARWQRMYDTGEDPGAGANGGAATQRREFLMRCPADGCRGFLSTAYKCGVCEGYTCSDCLEHLGASKEVAHTCDPNTVETAKAIKKETRPCPKCGARIFKIDGCDQMYCTVDGCQTAFSWQTGQVVTGRIHNPHYYEWLRRVNGGQAPREPGDIPGGGGGCEAGAGAAALPGGWEFTRAILRVTDFTTGEKNWLLAIHRAIGDLEHARLPNFPTQMSPTMYKLLNVQYLLGQIDEANWQRELELMEAAFTRKKEVGQILQTLVTAATDLLRAVFLRLGGQYTRLPLAEELTALEWVRTSALPELKALRDYTNESFKTLSVTKHMAVPQIGELWEWMPLRALYKPVPKRKGLTRSQIALRDEVDEHNGLGVAVAADVEDDGPPPLGEVEGDPVIEA